MKKTLISVFAIALMLFLPDSYGATSSPSPKPKAETGAWPVKQKIVYVALTPADDPTMWQQVVDDPTTEDIESGNLDFVKETVSNAISFWKKASNNRMQFVAPQFFVGKPGSAIAHCASSADIKTGMKIAGLKTIPKGTRLVVANINDTCGYAGLGAQSGSSLNLRSLSSATLIHELGHNFGFLHSSTIYCKTSTYSPFTEKNCGVDEYGDLRDVMGSDDYCPSSTLSATQRATIFGTPRANALKLGKIYDVDESREDSTNIIYELQVKKVWFFFEYFIPGKSDCLITTRSSRTPELQVRMIGPDWTLKSGPAIGPQLITRYEVEPNQPSPTPDADGYVMEPLKLTLNGFKTGEKFKLPGTTYYLNVISTGATSAQFSVTTS